jgi:predicted RNA binding protein YcfA (HicA-like mRNA interferase family)
LEKTGFKFVKQRGSHVKLRMFAGGRKLTVIVPLKPVIRTGTMKSILRQSNLKSDGLFGLLK